MLVNYKDAPKAAVVRSQLVGRCGMYVRGGHGQRVLSGIMRPRAAAQGAFAAPGLLISLD